MAKVERIGVDAWIAFRRLFTHLALNGQRPHYVIHGSCVADSHGRAAVIAGPSNAGKTSLLIAMLQRGYQLVCDDYVPIHIQNENILALPVGVTVAGSAFRFFPAIEALKQDFCRFFCERQWQWTINLSDLYTAAPAFSTFHPSHFYFVRADFEGESRVTECDREEALWHFQMSRLESPGQVPMLPECDTEYQEGCFRLARHLLEKGRFFRVRNGKSQQTADAIADSFS